MHLFLSMQEVGYKNVENTTGAWQKLCSHTLFLCLHIHVEGGGGRGLGGWKGGLKHSLLASSLLLCIPKIMGGPVLELLN